MRSHPLSPEQLQVWYLDQLLAPQERRNFVVGWRIAGELDVRKLAAAIALVHARHESLRLRIVAGEGEPRQAFDPDAAPDVDLVDLSNLDSISAEANLETLIAESAQRPIQLSEGPVFWAHVIRLGAADHVLLLTLHHIAADWASVNLLFRDLMDTYRGASAAPADRSNGGAYSATIVRRAQALELPDFRQHLDAWEILLRNPPPAVYLPFAKARPAEPSGRRTRLTHRFDAEFGTAVRSLCAHCRATPLMVLLGAVYTAVSRTSGSKDLIIGVPFANRVTADDFRMVGLFASIMPFRIAAAPATSVEGLIQDIRKSLLALMDHQQVSLERLLAAVAPKREANRHPLFQLMVNYLVVSEVGVPGTGLRCVPFLAATSDLALELSMYFIALKDDLSLVLEYECDAFEDGAWDGIVLLLDTVVKSMAKNARASLGELAVVDGSAARRQLQEWSVPLPGAWRDRCVHHYFEDVAARRPDAIAAIDGPERWTYAVLDAAANAVAKRLIDQGVHAGMLVGICMRRSLHLLAGILGILKAGAAYVPLDPGYPARRLRFMVADSKAAVVLVDGTTPLDGLGGCKTMRVDGNWLGLDTSSAARPDGAATGESLAYCIYTSGSTGEPKGAMIDHRNIAALVAWARDEFEPEDFAQVPFVTSVSFDLSVLEMFVTWSLGGSVNVLQDVIHLIETIEAPGEHAQFTLLQMVPSAMEMLLEATRVPRSVRKMIVGGEPLRRQLVERIFAACPRVRLYNGYGPTEDTVYSTACAMDRVPEGSITIGKPLPGKRLYILDAESRLLPIGIAGEICLAGAGLGRGYLDRPELVRERFVSDPFQAGERMYRTGDLGKFASTGEVIYLRRVDHQVKIRGHRIELGEIEAALEAEPGVRRAVVCAADGRAGAELVAFIVREPHGAMGAEKVRESLARTLPAYMIPARTVILDALPLTPNGKVDRLALSGLTAAACEEHAPPENHLHGQLAQIWADVLGRPLVRANDDFFDLGGTSLLAFRLLAEVRSQLGTELPLRSVFHYPTFDRFCRYLESLGQSGAAKIDATAPTAVKRQERRFTRMPP